MIRWHIPQVAPPPPAEPYTEPVVEIVEDAPVVEIVAEEASALVEVVTVVEEPEVIIAATEPTTISISEPEPEPEPIAPPPAPKRWWQRLSWMQ